MQQRAKTPPRCTPKHGVKKARPKQAISPPPCQRLVLGTPKPRPEALFGFPSCRANFGHYRQVDLDPRMPMPPEGP
jgi:hypothetical protein